MSIINPNNLKLYSEPDWDHEKEFYNRHAGETGLLVCTGPSLEQVPLEFLKKYPSMGVNRITLMFPKFIPTYYTCVGLGHYSTQELRDTWLPLVSHPDVKGAFLRREYSWLYPWKKVISTTRQAEIYGVPNFRSDQVVFSKSPECCYGCSTGVAYPCLQFLYWLGFQTVLIVGLDGRYPQGTTKQHFYDNSEAPGFAVGGGRYSDEFWESVANRLLGMANDVYKESGRRIINLSDPTVVTTLERGKLEDWA
jgi:hypothetical protein